MLRPDEKLRTAVAGGALALLLAAALFAPAPSGAQAIPETPEAPEAPAAPGTPAGQAIADRYTVEELTDSVLLRPKQESGAVRTIELTEDGEVLVNGKEFDADELAAFLGEDGRRLAELSELDFDELRAALGVAAAVEAAEAAAEEAAEIAAQAAEDAADVSVTLRGLPGAPHVRVHHARDDRVSVGRSIHVRAGETAADVVCVGCSVAIDGAVTGNVVAVGGSVNVNGRVEGDSVSIGGSVRVADGAEVGGEAVSVGGAVDVADGGKVQGQSSSIGIGGPLFGNFGNGWRFPWDVFGEVSSLLSAIFRTGVLVLLGVLAFLVMRPAVERAGRRAAEEPWKAVLAGLLLQLFFLPVLVIVTVVLAVSIIGIPLLALVPVALLAFVVSALVGFVAVGREVGRWVERRTGGKFTSPILTIVVGILVIQATSLVGRIVSLPGGILAIVGFTVVGLGFVLKYAAWTVGMGAMTLVLFGRDWRRPLPAEPASPADEETPPAEPAALPPPPAPAD